ncbi:MAG: bifunctional riboflavin kinase/FAD synthetase, partial [Halothiobacillaceae bacterium]
MELICGTGRRTPPGSVVTIGNFDGLHLGHQALMQRLDDVARTEGLRRVVLTFEPLPREVFSPHPVPRLMSLREKAAWLAASGLVDELRILRFNSALATQPAEDFVR